MVDEEALYGGSPGYYSSRGSTQSVTERKFGSRNLGMLLMFTAGVNLGQDLGRNDSIPLLVSTSMQCMIGTIFCKYAVLPYGELGGAGT